MDKHPFYGISAKEKGWVPSPSYVLRRYRVLRMLDHLPKGRLLEIGCGAGALLNDLSHMGFFVEAIETSLAALEVARYINWDNRHVIIHATIQNHWNNSFDYILACEVLEHIEDDVEALKQWRTWLKGGGYLIVSVPSHPQRWSASDEWAGHFRRYEQQNLRSVLEESGFSIIQIESYGFPLANMIAPVRSQYHTKQLKRQLSRASIHNRRVRNDRSGIERPIENRLFFLQASWLGTMILKFFCALQDIFSDTNLGDGLIALCKKE